MFWAFLFFFPFRVDLLGVWLSPVQEMVLLALLGKSNDQDLADRYCITRLAYWDSL